MWVGGRGLGLIGGIVGLIASAFVLLVGVLGRAVPSENSGLLVVSGVLGLAVSVIALVGATRAQVNPVLAAVLMWIAGLAGFIVLGLFWVVPGPLLLVSGALAFRGRKAQHRSGLTPPGQFG